MTETKRFPPARRSAATKAMGRGFLPSVLPWVICGLAAAFYCYEFLLRITPGLMIPELQRAFSINGQYLDATLVAELSLFYYWAYTPMQLPVGLLMDRYGPRWILSAAVFCCAIGTVLFGATNSWSVAATGRFLIGFGSAFAFVGVLKLASTWLPPNRFALVSGLATTLGMIGAMLGAVFLSELIGTIGWQETLLYSSYIGFVLVPVMWLVVRDTPSDLKITAGSVVHCAKVVALSYSQLWVEIRNSIKNGQIWINGMIGGLLMAPTMVFPELWGKLYLQTVHEFSPFQASSAVTLIFLGWAVGSPLAGFFSDWLLRRRLPLIVGACGVLVILLIFLFVPNLSLNQIRCLMFLLGVFSSVEVICFAIGRENCSDTLAGTAIAFTNFMINCFAISQILVAKILDVTWDGTLIDQAKVYNVESYHSAMLVLPTATTLAILLSVFFLKETYCRPLSERKA